MNVQAVVEKLGFRPAEARIYLALMSLQEATVSDLARKVGMPRTTVQGVVEDLYERGLVTCYVSRRRKVWCAEHPRKLLARHQQLERHLQEVIPTLERMRTVHAEAAKTFIYEGRPGIRFLLDDILATREKVAIMGNADILRMAVGDSEWGRFLTSSQGQVPLIQMVGKTPSDGVFPASVQIHTSELGQHATHTVICLYGTRVAIVHDLNGIPAVTLLHNIAVNELLMTLFTGMWVRG